MIVIALMRRASATIGLWYSCRSLLGGSCTRIAGDRQEHEAERDPYGREEDEPEESANEDGTEVAPAVGGPRISACDRQF